MNKKIWKKISSMMVIANGAICLAFSENLINFLPMICGVVLIFKGLIMFIQGIRDKDYDSLEGIGLERSIVILAVGIGILVKQQDALFIVGVFWGLHGLNSAASYLNEALYYRKRKGKFMHLIIEAAIEFVLSLILIFDPITNIGHHIVILGIELIIDGTFELLIKERVECIRS